MQAMRPVEKDLQQGRRQIRHKLVAAAPGLHTYSYIICANIMQASQPKHALEKGLLSSRQVYLCTDTSVQCSACIQTFRFCSQCELQLPNYASRRLASLTGLKQKMEGQLQTRGKCEPIGGCEALNTEDTILTSVLQITQTLVEDYCGRSVISPLYTRTNEKNTSAKVRCMLWG